jgi:thioredoxin-like negative regulator of GroEL
MGTLTTNERKALDELFTAMQEKRNFLDKIRSSRKEMLKIFKYLAKSQKTISKHY